MDSGRVDDVINVSGHRMGTAEVESALVAHDSVASLPLLDFMMLKEVFMHLSLNSGVEYTDELKAELKQQ